MNINFLKSRIITFICLGLAVFAGFYYFQNTKNNVIQLYSFKEVYKERFQVRLVDDNGKENGFLVDKVDDEKSQEKGLMFINVMEPQNGLLFEFNPPTEVSFWMKNTYIPLDLIYIGEDNIVKNISKNAKILDTEAVLASKGKIKYVLEINAGYSDKLNILEGDKLILENYAK